MKLYYLSYVIIIEVFSGKFGVIKWRTRWTFSSEHQGNGKPILRSMGC